MPMLWLYILLALIALVLIVLVANIRVVPQAHSYVVERIGTYYQTWQTGLHFKIPFIDRVAKKVSLKETVVDFAPQAVITKDNVTMQIDTVVFFQITDPKLFTYGVNNPLSAIEFLTATTLRNIIGDLELDNTLTSATSSTTASPPSSTKPPINGASRSTGWRSKTSSPPKRSRTLWSAR